MITFSAGTNNVQHDGVGSEIEVGEIAGEVFGGPVTNGSDALEPFVH